MDCVILKSMRNNKNFDRLVEWWPEVIKRLEQRKIKVHENPVDADLSIVLSGMFENPALLKGKRVLAFKPQEWFPGIPPPHGWNMYKGMLEFYYDDFIDLSGLSPKKAVGKIVEYINEAKESRSSD